MKMKPFRNETSLDPGRFRTKVTFYQQTNTVKPSGGTTVGFTELKTVKAIDLQIGNHDQAAVSAGASTVNDDRYFVIRSGFKPDIDMVAKANGNRYIVVSVTPVDMPVRYWRVLCIRKDDQETWEE